jgi:hypothetical protein
MQDFLLSLPTIPSLATERSQILHVDNASSTDVLSLCDAVGVSTNRVRYNKNLFDISLFYSTLWHAESVNADYIGFIYDDSIIFDGEKLYDCLEFMDYHKDISCLRISKYDRKLSHLYDTAHTSKEQNPDSIRHYNNVTNEPLEWSEPTLINESIFYKNNWHYTSRPCIWRLADYQNLVNDLKLIPILQGFETHCMLKYHELQFKTGVLDSGMVMTTSTKNSARTRELDPKLENGIRIPLEELRNQYESHK